MDYLLAQKPQLLMEKAGYKPDDWQVDLLMGDWTQLLTLCSRQAGKSQIAAAVALLTAIMEAPATVLIVSRALRQAVELFRKVKQLYLAMQTDVIPASSSWLPLVGKELEEEDDKEFLKQELKRLQLGEGEELVMDSVLQMEMKNGSRIICLPASADTIVGFSSISLLILDEAARIPDVVYHELTPMLGVAKGRRICLSTPKGKRGWFWEENKRYEDAVRVGKPTPWKRISVTADRCPRLSAEFLRMEQESMGERWYLQNYGCQFLDAEDAVFREEDIEAAMHANEEYERWFV